MVKPDIEKLPTSQMMAFCQVFGRPEGSKEEMIASLQEVTATEWKKATVAFKVDQLG